MIAKIFIFLLLLIALPDIYIYVRYMRGLRTVQRWLRLLWWLPGLCMAAYTLALTMERDFAPADITWLHVYLFLIGMLVTPKFVFAVCSLVGWGARRLFRLRRNYGNPVGLLLVALNLYILIYGTAIGFGKLTVRRVDYVSGDLPSAFDGYRIVQFSDAHVGSYNSWRTGLLAKAVDSINAQRADMVVFTGDLQNMHPRELRPHMCTLGLLHTPDGVFSVMGNHDYADYLKVSHAVKEANCREMVERQRQMGWTLLLNDHRVIRRGDDSIVVAGMENDGVSKRYPERGDVARTLRGISDGAFIVMLQHDPTCWRRKILPQSSAQLTLSGHTHAMQFELFGWSPASLLYREWGGFYREGNRAINVSTGLGGLIPFRFGVPGEIVVITLHRKGNKNK